MVARHINNHRSHFGVNHGANSGMGHVLYDARNRGAFCGRTHVAFKRDVEFHIRTRHNPAREGDHFAGVWMHKPFYSALVLNLILHVSQQDVFNRVSATQGHERQRDSPG